MKLRYEFAWRAGDAYAGRRWAVMNVTHGLIAAEVATVDEAAQWLKDIRKRRAAIARAKGNFSNPPKKNVKVEEARKWIEKKLAAAYGKSIPFPA